MNTIVGDFTSVFDKVTLEEKEQQICDSFDKETLGSMFTADEGTTLSDGHLTLRAGESTPIFAWANAHTSDFTFKTRAGGLKDSGNGTAAAGVMSMADKEDAVVLARRRSMERICWYSENCWMGSCRCQALWRILIRMQM